jgi:hypothetical protein
MYIQYIEMSGNLTDKMYDNYVNIRTILKDHQKFMKMYKKIEVYKCFDTKDDMDYYYIAFDSPCSELMINPLDVVLVITFSDNKIHIKSVDDIKILENDIYERIIDFTAVLKLDEKHNAERLINNDNAERLINNDNVFGNSQFFQGNIVYNDCNSLSDFIDFSFLMDTIIAILTT